jgi:hypothetical protein
MQVLKHAWSRRLDFDFVVTSPTGQPVHPPVWQSMWACVQSDLREACTAYASPRAQNEFVDFGWSMPHLEYSKVEQVHFFSFCFHCRCSSETTMQTEEFVYLEAK